MIGIQFQMQFLIGPKILIYIYWWAQGRQHALNLLEFKHTLPFISVMAEYALPSMNPTHLSQQGFTFWALNTSFQPESTLLLQICKEKNMEAAKSCYFLSTNARMQLHFLLYGSGIMWLISESFGSSFIIDEPLDF